MPYKEREITKKYFTIGEVAEKLEVNTSLIRFWESEFDILSPKKNKKGLRKYTKKDIDIELAKSIISKIVKDTNREIDINYIQEIVSKFFNISIAEMKDKARNKEIVIARQVAMYFSKDFTNNSLKSIGFHFGGRDHSTVIHAVQSVNDMIDTDNIFRKNIEEINRRISVG